MISVPVLSGSNFWNSASRSERLDTIISLMLFKAEDSRWLILSKINTKDNILGQYV